MWAYDPARSNTPLLLLMREHVKLGVRGSDNKYNALAQTLTYCDFNIYDLCLTLFICLLPYYMTILVKWH